MSLNCSYDYDRLGVSESFRRRWFGVHSLTSRRSRLGASVTLNQISCGVGACPEDSGRRVPRNDSEHFIF